MSYSFLHSKFCHSGLQKLSHISQDVVFQLLSHIQLFVTPWTTPFQVPLSYYLLEFAQIHVIESVILSIHLIFCHPLFLLPSIFPSMRVFSNESTLYI